MATFTYNFNNKSIKSLQTTRLHGKSQVPYDSFNMGVFGKDTQAQANVRSLKNVPHDVVFMQQEHGNKVVEYKHQPSQHGEVCADACFTRQKDIVCAILTADCLPVLIVDEAATVVAAVHCGWRGLYADILTKTIEKMAIPAKNLCLWLGPCISYRPYIVDAEFRQKFVQKDKRLAHCFYRDKKQKWHADLKKIALTQLHGIGVKSIAQSPYCTFENKQLFYSYRRDGETGRTASLVWLC